MSLRPAYAALLAARRQLGAGHGRAQEFQDRTGHIIKFADQEFNMLAEQQPCAAVRVSRLICTPVRYPSNSLRKWHSKTPALANSGAATSFLEKLGVRRTRSFK